MGAPMAGHVLKAGYAVKLFNRTKCKAESLLSAGADWADSPAACAEGCEVVFSMVGYPGDVEAVHLGAEGVAASVEP
ncbi:unnamed protein product, partial [marine sediment metagenome]